MTSPLEKGQISSGVHLSPDRDECLEGRLYSVQMSVGDCPSALYTMHLCLLLYVTL